MDKPNCNLCGHKHWPREPHIWSDVKPAEVEPLTVDDSHIKPMVSRPVMKGAAAMGRAGGLSRAKKLSAKRRSEIAKKAAQKRWEK